MIWTIIMVLLLGIVVLIILLRVLFGLRERDIDAG
jgi:hypothetical protein